MSDPMEIDLRVQAILVMEEAGSEHNNADGMDRLWVNYEARAVYLPALHVLCVERTITPAGRHNGETVYEAVIVDDYAAAVRRAVGCADAAKVFAKAKATEER